MDLLVATILLIINIYYIFKLKRGYVFYVIIVNILYDVLIGLISPGESNVSNYIAYSRALVNILYISYYSYLVNFKNLKIGKFFVVFAIYLFVVGLFSSNFLTTISSVSKVLITVFYFGIGYVEIMNRGNISKMYKGIYISSIIVILNFLVANLFKIGQTSYSSYVSFYAGGFHVGALNTLAIFFIVLFSNIQQKRIDIKTTYIIAATILIFTFELISMKRVPIAASLVGLVLITFKNEKWLNSLKYLFIFAIIMLISLPIYKDLLIGQFEARNNQMKIETLESESRYLELKFIYQDILQSTSVNKALFGEELFNSIGKYAQGYFGPRDIHTDHGKLLHGAGLIGLILYLMTFAYLFLKYYRISKKERLENKDLMNVYLAILIVMFMMTFSEGLLAVSYKTSSLMILGSILGYLSRQKYLRSKK